MQLGGATEHETLINQASENVITDLQSCEMFRKMAVRNNLIVEKFYQTLQNYKCFLQ